MASIAIPEELQKMNRFFEEAGFEAYLVGGAVRDSLRGDFASDWDIATNARPEDVMKIFKKVIPTGIDHGTVTVHFMGRHIEVTTFRTETDYRDSRHPSSVQFNASLGEDLSRRDFTINAIAANLKTGRIIDPFNGQVDIKNRCIQTVGNPIERFTEDALRPIRAIRFSSQLSYEISPETYDAIKKVKNTIPNMSIERFRDEFQRMLMTAKPSIALRLLEDTGILALFIPEYAVSNTKSSLQRIITNSYPIELNNTISMLSQIGIASKASSGGSLSNTQLRGYLEIDEKKLDAALKESMGEIKNLFGIDTDGDLVIDSGIAYLIDKQLQAYVTSGGILSMKNASLDTKITSSQKQIDRLEVQIAKKEQELKIKYGNMESALNSLQSQSDSLTNFTNSYNNNK
jgi:tRNA nucleotidyltransferase/poly(A) polymerase